jgi:tight adherence protein B
MQGQLNLLVAFALFVTSVAVVIGLGLFIISLVLKAQARHRKRLGRVGRKRMLGQLDIDEVRMQLLRQKAEANVLVALTAALARFIPLLDTVRLQANIRRAGMKLTLTGFIVIALVTGAVVVALAALTTGYPLPLLVLPSLLAGMFLTDAFVRFRGEVMANRFMKQLPEVLDTIIRGVRSGLPVIECIATVGQEFDEPVGGHFRAIAERVALGETIDSALWRSARVVNRPEMDFLAVCVSIQMETGGSLSEALTNLAEVLRERARMKLKIRAISSEAKMSAIIIGCLPFAMLGLLTVMSPDYVMPLFTDPRGQTMLLLGLGSMVMGAIVMWRMTQFEI